jgi:hypothetical protein
MVVLTTGLRLSLIAIALIQASEVRAQENIPIGPKDVAAWVEGADSIVIGTFRAGLPFPWIDGWHYQSRIDVREQIVPAGAIKPVDLSWIRPYGTSCLICKDLRPLDGQNGIYFLRRRNGTSEVFGGTTSLCSAPLDIRYIGAVRGAVRNRSQTVK